MMNQLDIQTQIETEIYSTKKGGTQELH